MCSNGDSTRSSTVSASAPMRSRRREATCIAHSASLTVDGRWPSSSGLSRLRESMPEDDRFPADRFRDGGVLALRVAGNVDAAAERERPGVEGLRQAGLAGADDPRQNDVGGGDEACVVEHPRVVDEAPAGVEVLANEHPGRAEAPFGEERILSRECRGGVLMLGKPKPARASAARPGRARPPRADSVVARRSACSASQRLLRLRFLRVAGSGLDPGGGLLASFAVPAALTFRADQHRRV